MKDRIKRTNIKKPSHRLFRTMIAVCSISLGLSGLLSFALIHVTGENKNLNQTIENYTLQIDMLQKNDSDTYHKNNP